MNTAVPLPNVQYIAMDTAEKHLLAFSGSDDVVRWVDLTTIDPNTEVPPYYTLTLSGNPLPLSRPVAAFFSADNTKAYVLSCGTECGGSNASTVTQIDTTSITPPSSLVPGTTYTDTPISATVVKQWSVSGARRGLIDLSANKLYVAGSTSNLIDSGGNNVQNGYFTVIDLTALTASTPILIGNGAKTLIRNINGVFWVGSTNCGVQSCISMVNLSAGTATTLSTANGNGTGISLSVNSGEVYTIEGGEFFIYDQQGNPISSQYNTDIKGQAYDVLYID